MAREQDTGTSATARKRQAAITAAGVVLAHSTSHCAVCGKERVSIYSFPGVAQDGGGQICFECWARGCTTRPSVEGEPVAGPAAPAGVEPVQKASPYQKPGKKDRTDRCERCGASLPRTIARRITAPHYCVPCQESLARPADRVPFGAITAARVQNLESAFLQHINEGINRIKAWPGEEHLPKRRVRRDTRRSLLPLPEDYLESHPLQDALRKRLDETPTRAHQRWDVRFGGRWPWQRNRQDLSVVAATWVPMRDVLEQGYAVEPAGKHALMDLAALRADEQNAPSLLLAFSPTGWDPDLIPPANTVLVSRDDQGQWTARKGAMASGMRSLARAIVAPPLEHSEIDRCVAQLTALPPSRFPVSARQMAREEAIVFDTVVEGMRAFAKANPSYLVCEDDLRDDFLLEMRG